MIELADTSAWLVCRRRGKPGLGEWFEGAVKGGEIATCDMIRVELLTNSRNHEEFRSDRGALEGLPDCPVNKPEWERTLSVYEQLAAQGGAHQRSVGHADLLIAAAAEGAGIPVLHYDSDFERIAEITGQPARWIVPRGSL